MPYNVLLPYHYAVPVWELRGNLRLYCIRFLVITYLMKIKALKSKWLCGKNFDEGKKYAKRLVYLKYLIRLSQDIHTIIRKALLNCPINVNSQIELVLSETRSFFPCHFTTMLFSSRFPCGIMELGVEGMTCQDQITQKVLLWYVNATHYYYSFFVWNT